MYNHMGIIMVFQVDESASFISPGKSYKDSGDQKYCTQKQTAWYKMKSVNMFLIAIKEAKYTVK